MGTFIEMIKRDYTDKKITGLDVDIFDEPRGRRNNNPNASHLEKITVVELRKKCTEHDIKYMHVLKNLN